jgi:hypothetical protein
MKKKTPQRFGGVNVWKIFFAGMTVDFTIFEYFCMSNGVGTNKNGQEYNDVSLKRIYSNILQPVIDYKRYRKCSIK